MLVSRGVQVTTVSWRTLDKRPLSGISLAFWVLTKGAYSISQVKGLA
jgi:hypothetical protein